MARPIFDVIAFDGDDTLWHNERSYRSGRETFHRLLASAGVALTDDEIEECVNRTELRNIPYYGYGVASFVLSLIETAIEVTRGRIAGAELRTLIDLAKQMLTEDVELFDGAREAVHALAASYPLMLVTKGDLLHQSSKVERSGLRRHFSFVEVVCAKTHAVYADILSRHDIRPERFLMVGNSVRSDVLPVLELGAWAIHVPAALSWSHEHAEVPDAARSRCFQVATLHGLPRVLESLGDLT